MPSRFLFIWTFFIKMHFHPRSWSRIRILGFYPSRIQGSKWPRIRNTDHVSWIAWKTALLFLYVKQYGSYLTGFSRKPGSHSEVRQMYNFRIATFQGNTPLRIHKSTSARICFQLQRELALKIYKISWNFFRISYVGIQRKLLRKQKKPHSLKPKEKIFTPHFWQLKYPGSYSRELRNNFLG
jgi:hypothetical protein